MDKVTTKHLKQRCAVSNLFRKFMEQNKEYEPSHNIETFYSKDKNGNVTVVFDIETIKTI